MNSVMWGVLGPIMRVWGGGGKKGEEGDGEPVLHHFGRYLVLNPIEHRRDAH